MPCQNKFEQVRRDRLITVNRIIEIHRVLEQNDAGIRTQGGTVLKNEMTGETVYTPPQTHEEIVRLMNNLEHYINDDALSDADPLVKLAVIHHQFESIPPLLRWQRPNRPHHQYSVPGGQGLARYSRTLFEPLHHPHQG